MIFFVASTFKEAKAANISANIERAFHVLFVDCGRATAALNDVTITSL